MKFKLGLLAILSTAVLAQAKTIHTLHLRMELAPSPAGYMTVTGGVGTWKHGFCTVLAGTQQQQQGWLPAINKKVVINKAIEMSADDVAEFSSLPVNCMKLTFDYHGQHWADEFQLNWNSNHTQVLSTTPAITEVH